MHIHSQPQHRSEPPLPQVPGGVPAAPAEPPPRAAPHCAPARPRPRQPPGSRGSPAPRAHDPCREFSLPAPAGSCHPSSSAPGLLFNPLVPPLPPPHLVSFYPPLLFFDQKESQQGKIISIGSLLPSSPPIKKKAPPANIWKNNRGLSPLSLIFTHMLR